MTTLKIEIDDDVARAVEESAQRERKSVSEWIEDRLKGGSALEAMEARAAANGYPPAWRSLYGSLAGEESFVAPVRSAARVLPLLDSN